MKSILIPLINCKIKRQLLSCQSRKIKTQTLKLKNVLQILTIPVTGKSCSFLASSFVSLFVKPRF